MWRVLPSDRHVWHAPRAVASTDGGEREGTRPGTSRVDSFRIYITARVGGVDTTELLAYVDQGDPQLAPGARSVDLHVVDVDIVDFVFAEGGYAVRIEATGLLPPDDVVFTGSVTYDVTVGLLE